MAENPKQQVRRPGSQVAPGQKPFHRPGQTASTHSRVTLEAATAGKLYRVRDKMDANGTATVWGDLLTYEDAKRLKETVVGRRRSRTARLEEMTEAEIAAARGAAGGATPQTDWNPTGTADATLIAAAAPARSAFPAPMSSRRSEPTPAAPVDYLSLPGGDLFRALGDDAGKWTDAFVQYASSRGIRLSKDDEGFILAWFASAIESRPRPVDPHLENVRQAAVAAVAPVARQAQIRADNAKPKKPAVPSAPPTPPPSPLTDELVDVGDGPAELPPDEDTALDSSDVQDLTADVGGGPSADDAARARAQAERDIEEMTVAAKNAYDAAARDHVGSGPWPTWEKLGDFEHAAWRYYVQNGGDPPELVKEPRKVAHAMGSAS